MRRLAHLLALFREECKPANAVGEASQRLLGRSYGNLDSRLWWNKSAYSLVIQSQNGQSMAHRFQNLRAKGILQARENESIRAAIQWRHFFPRQSAEELHLAIEAEALCALFPRLAHFSVAGDQQLHSEVLCLFQGFQREGQSLSRLHAARPEQGERAVARLGNGLAQNKIRREPGVQKRSYVPAPNSTQQLNSVAIRSEKNGARPDCFPQEWRMR